MPYEDLNRILLLCAQPVSTKYLVANYKWKIQVPSTYLPTHLLGTLTFTYLPTHLLGTLTFTYLPTHFLGTHPSTYPPII